VTEGDASWARASEAYQDRLMRAGDIADRAALLSDSPMFSFWTDIKATLKSCEEEIRSLRRQLEANRNDAA
jgi:hypothetical protein